MFAALNVCVFLSQPNLREFMFAFLTEEKMTHPPQWTIYCKTIIISELCYLHTKKYVFKKGKTFSSVGQAKKTQLFMDFRCVSQDLVIFSRVQVCMENIILQDHRY